MHLGGLGTAADWAFCTSAHINILAHVTRSCAVQFLGRDGKVVPGIRTILSLSPFRETTFMATFTGQRGRARGLQGPDPRFEFVNICLGYSVAVRVSRRR
jgi:hypothetical protein